MARNARPLAGPRRRRKTSHAEWHPLTPPHLAEPLEGLESLRVRHGKVLRAAHILQEGVLRADAGVVQAGEGWEGGMKDAGTSRQADSESKAKRDLPSG
jgi:hypothetical protein